MASSNAGSASGIVLLDSIAWAVAATNPEPASTAQAFFPASTGQIKAISLINATLQRTIAPAMQPQAFFLPTALTVGQGCLAVEHTVPKSAWFAGTPSRWSAMTVCRARKIAPSDSTVAIVRPRLLDSLPLDSAQTVR